MDAHLSSIIAKWLHDDFGYSCKSSFVLKLHGLDDMDIYNKAKAAGFVILLTKDSDFPALIKRLGSPPKVINVVADNMKSRVLYSLIKPHIEYCIRMLTQFNHQSIEINLLP